MKRGRLIIWVGGVLFLWFFVLLLAASRTTIGAVLINLPLGWWRFLRRNVPQVSYDWGLIVTGVTCTAVVLVLGNWFMGALLRQLQKRREADEPLRKWRWSWTLGLYAAVWILFLIAFGAAGVLRHTTWLLNFHQPWYEERLNSSAELRIADGTVEQLMLENDLDLEKTLRAIAAERGYRRARNPICEDFDVILYGNGSNQVAACLIIPRNPKLLAKGDFAAWAPDSHAAILPLSQLEDTMSKMEAKYPADTSR